MAWFYATNGIANTTNAQGKRWYKALQKMEFNVVQDVFHGRPRPWACATCSCR